MTRSEAKLINSLINDKTKLQNEVEELTEAKEELQNEVTELTAANDEMVLTMDLLLNDILPNMTLS